VVAPHPLPLFCVPCVSGTRGGFRKSTHNLTHPLLHRHSNSYTIPKNYMLQCAGGLWLWWRFEGAHRGSGVWDVCSSSSNGWLHGLQVSWELQVGWWLELELLCRAQEKHVEHRKAGRGEVRRQITSKAC